MEFRHQQSMPLGVVVRRTQGVTRWAKWVWKPVSVLPGAGEANWKELRREGDTVEFHAATVPLELYRSDTEAYLTALSETVPPIYVIMRQVDEENADFPLEVLLATASPYEGQDYADTGEEIVEKVPMPPGLIAWVRAFVQQHHEEEEFIKRKRDRKRVDVREDGVGDSRIKQMTDVYRSPGRRRNGPLQ